MFCTYPIRPLQAAMATLSFCFTPFIREKTRKGENRLSMPIAHIVREAHAHLRGDRTEGNGE